MTPGRGLRRRPPPSPVAESPRTAVTLGHAWTAEQDEELRDGVEIGCTLDELADQLDLDVEPGRGPAGRARPHRAAES